MGRGRTKTSSQVALGGVMAALALVLIYLASVIPTAQIGVAAVAGLCPLVVVVGASFPAGFLSYAASGILALLLVPSKSCAVMYAILLGLYPVLKGLIERLHNIVLELLIKLVYFNIVMTLMWFVFGAMVLPMLPELLNVAVWFYIVGNIVFLIYDYGVSKLITAFGPRIVKMIRRS
ncbi:MAG: hypothetical protein LUC17_00265 [Oscillospiraceae bacterium]|nr:hypothetical protein [Oscillospiraceae bacterium]